jgi:hypothetical protein
LPPTSTSAVTDAAGGAAADEAPHAAERRPHTRRGARRLTGGDARRG